MLLKLIFDDFFPGVKRHDIVKAEGEDCSPDQLFFGDTGALALFFKIMPSGGEERFFRDEPHEFTARDSNSQFFSLKNDLIENAMDGSDFIICEVDRYLGDAVILDIPSDRKSVV